MPYIAEPSDDTTSSGGISRLSSGRATRSTCAPWSCSSRPLARSSSIIAGMYGSASLSPFHRSKSTPSALNSRFNATIDTSCIARQIRRCVGSPSCSSAVALRARLLERFIFLRARGGGGIDAFEIFQRE